MIPKPLRKREELYIRRERNGDGIGQINLVPDGELERFQRKLRQRSQVPEGFGQGISAKPRVKCRFK